jgi:hypothetical protein
MSALVRLITRVTRGEVGTLASKEAGEDGDEGGVGDTLASRAPASLRLPDGAEGALGLPEPLGTSAGSSSGSVLEADVANPASLFGFVAAVGGGSSPCHTA